MLYHWIRGLWFTAFFLITFSATRAEPIHLPLVRRSRSSANPKDLLASHRLRRHVSVGNSIGKQTREAPGNFNLTDEFTDYYFAELHIGTPPKTFKTLMDITISQVIVAGSACTVDLCGLLSVPLYDETLSSTSTNKTTNVSYIDTPLGGIVDGYFVADTITLGSVTVSQAEFFEATQISSGSLLLPDPTSGVLGLGFDSLGQAPIVPFWHTLMNSGAVAAEMGFWISRVLGTNDPAPEEPGGVFTLGGVNPSFFSGDVEFLDLVPNNMTSWALTLSGFTVQNISVPVTHSSSLATFDTTTPAIFGPSQDVEAIYATIPGSSFVNSSGSYQFPCNTTVKVSVSFGGKMWPINPVDMNSGPAFDKSQCFGTISPLDDTAYWTFGIPFMKNVYTVLCTNPPSVGFAELSTMAGGIGEPNASLSSIYIPSASSSVSKSTSSASTSFVSSSASGTPVPTLGGGPSKKYNIGAIIGATIAGVVVLIGIVVFIFCRGRRGIRKNSVPHVTVFVGNPPGSGFPSKKMKSAVLSTPMEGIRTIIATANRSNAASETAVPNPTPEGPQLDENVNAPTSADPSPAAISPGAATMYPAVLQELQNLRSGMALLLAGDHNEAPPTYASENSNEREQ
ncbi:Lysosomal aspartic protease [Mycena sanguinolenta]|uniref:Lysosomal aspartic protease n=1 Tax=Mycena sanguinolenta TaxID=230812 RepID=A0A8H6X6A0_9AGAR|nr:Lysosomal aspartic protease [Mycena sanguinolenta]